jgi:hypothetical protein
MDIFLHWHSTASVEVDRATKNNKPEMARRASAGIDTGNMLWQSFVLQAGGEMITSQGTEGQAKIPADKLEELPEIIERVEKATDSRISCGVGFEQNEAEIAMKVAEHRGGKPAVVLYSEGVAQEAHDTEESKEDSELGPILSKDAAALEDGAPEADGGEDPTLHKAEGDAKPGEASKIAAGTKDPMAAQMSAPSPLTPGSPIDPNAAGQGAAPAAGQPQDPNQLKQAIVSVLQDVKTNMASIQQLQQTDPKAFQSVIGLVQAFVAVAQQAFGPAAAQSMQKSEESEGELSELSDDQDIAAQSLVEEAHAIKDYGDRKKKAKSPKLKDALDHAIGEEESHAQDFVEAMEKDEPAPGVAKPMRPGVRHIVHLPVGSQLDTSSGGTSNAGKIKVRMQDGRTRFVSVRAGQVLGPSGHANSSREPSSR